MIYTADALQNQFLRIQELNNSNHNRRVLILLADKYDEPFIVDLFCRIRDKRILINLIGLTSGIVRGVHGLLIHPELSLLEISEQTHPDEIQALIVPGGHHCAKTLLTDPRVHHLLEEIIKRNGLVFVASSAQEILEETTIPKISKDSHLFKQDRQKARDFLEEIIDRLITV